MTGFPKIIVKLENIPQEMKDKKQWINWVYELPEKEGDKPKKLPVAPYLTKSLFPVSAPDPNNWTTFEEAIKTANENNIGIGFSFTKESSICGIDLDHVLGDKKREEWAKEILDLAKSYSEVSPSGKGFHIYGYGKTGNAPRDDYEIYSEKHFFTVTGYTGQKGSIPMGDIQKALDKLNEMDIDKTAKKLTIGKMVDGTVEGNRDLTTLQYADLLFAQGHNQEQVLDILVKWDLKNIDKNGNPYILGEEAIKRIAKQSRRWIEKQPRKEQPRVELPLLNEVTYGNNRDTFIEHLQENYLFYCDREDKNLTLYVWDGKVWKDNAEAIFLDENAQIAKNEKSKMSKDELLDYFKGKGQHTEIKILPTNLIPFTNGFYDLDTGQSKPLNPEYFYVNIIPYDYDSKAKCPAWEQFQKDIHLEKDLLFAQEWFGYLLYRAYPREAFLIAIGVGANGKSVEFKVISTILGAKNVTNASLQDLTYNEFERAECYQKLAVICADLTSTKIVSTGILKRLSSGDSMHAQRKFGQPFDFGNYAKPSFACNDPPDILDDTDSLWNRFKLMKYVYIFSANPNTEKGEKKGTEREQLIKTLIDEAPGILNWMLEGLKRLRNNKFVFSVSALNREEVRSYYRRKSKPCICWLEDCFIDTENDMDMELKEDVFPHFKKWCKLYGIKTIPSSSMFFKTLIDEGLETMQPHGEKRRYVGYKLISLVELEKTLALETAKQLIVIPRKIDDLEDIKKINKEDNKEGDKMGEGNSEGCFTVSEKRFEIYMREQQSVGVLKALTDLGINENQLRGLMVVPGCKVMWGLDGRTLNYREA